MFRILVKTKGLTGLSHNLQKDDIMSVSEKSMMACSANDNHKSQVYNITVHVPGRKWLDKSGAVEKRQNRQTDVKPE